MPAVVKNDLEIKDDVAPVSVTLWHGWCLIKCIHRWRNITLFFIDLFYGELPYWCLDDNYHGVWVIIIMKSVIFQTKISSSFCYVMTLMWSTRCLAYNTWLTVICCWGVYFSDFSGVKFIGGENWMFSCGWILNTDFLFCINIMQ